MADTKISALSSASTPLAGTEVLPIVQSGVTVKVSVANLTTGRAVASAGGAFSDNFTQGVAGKGVNFTANTPAAGMTSQLLNWYEAGTWTPTDGSGAGRTFTNLRCTYTRIGRQVTVTAFFTTDVSASAAPFQVNGLPFATVANGFSTGTFGSSGSNAGLSIIYASSSAIYVTAPTSYNTNLTNAQVSNCGVAITITYQI